MARSWTKCYVCGRHAPNQTVAVTDPQGNYRYQIPRGWYVDWRLNGVLCPACYELKKAVK